MRTFDDWDKRVRQFTNDTRLILEEFPQKPEDIDGIARKYIAQCFTSKHFSPDEVPEKIRNYFYETLDEAKRIIMDTAGSPNFDKGVLERAIIGTQLIEGKITIDELGNIYTRLYSDDIEENNRNLSRSTIEPAVWEQGAYYIILDENNKLQYLKTKREQGFPADLPSDIKGAYKMTIDWGGARIGTEDHTPGVHFYLDHKKGERFMQDPFTEETVDEVSIQVNDLGHTKEINYCEDIIRSQPEAWYVQTGRQNYFPQKKQYNVGFEASYDGTSIRKTKDIFSFEDDEQMTIPHIETLTSFMDTFIIPPFTPKPVDLTQNI